MKAKHYLFTFLVTVAATQSFFDRGFRETLPEAYETEGAETVNAPNLRAAMNKLEGQLGAAVVFLTVNGHAIKKGE